jgi:uncharacterized protein (TIRG00374 family)
MIGIVILAVSIYVTNPFKILFEVKHLNYYYLAIGVVISNLALILYASSWHIILREFNVKIRLWETIQYTFVGLFVAWLLPIPLGLEATRAYLVMKKENSSVGKAIGSVVVHKSFYNISFGVIISMAVSFITLIYKFKTTSINYLIWFMIAFGVGSSIFFVSFLNKGMLEWLYERFPSRVQGFFSSLIKYIGSEKEDAITVIEDIGGILPVLRVKIFLTILSFILVAIQWFGGPAVSLAVGLSLKKVFNIWEMVLVWAFAEFIQQVNILIPGGIGVIDVGLASGLKAIGVPSAEAETIAVISRVVTYWLELPVITLTTLIFSKKEILRITSEKDQ